MQMLSVAAAAAASNLPVAYPADQWDRIYDIWLLLAVVIYLIVALPMLYFLFRYRYRKSHNETGSTEEGSPGIEVLWTVVPLIVVVYLAIQGAVLYANQRTAPPDAIPIRTEGMMWSWLFEYPNGKQSVMEMVVPVGKPVKLLLTSRDVIHAFYIPAAKTMEDAIPGRVNQLWFQFNQTGEYQAFCREYCGTAHAYMLATIRVVTQQEYDAWLAGS